MHSYNEHPWPKPWFDFCRINVFPRSVVEGTHSESKVAFPKKFTRDFVDHMGPRAIGVFDWAGF